MKNSIAKCALKTKSAFDKWIPVDSVHWIFLNFGWPPNPANNSLLSLNKLLRKCVLINRNFNPIFMPNPPREKAHSFYLTHAGCFSIFLSLKKDGFINLFLLCSFKYPARARRRASLLRESKTTPCKARNGLNFPARSGGRQEDVSTLVVELVRLRRASGELVWQESKILFWKDSIYAFIIGKNY